MQKRAKKTTYQTRGQLDKHDFGKKVEKPGQKAKRKRKNSKSDQGPAGQT